MPPASATPASFSRTTPSFVALTGNPNSGKTTLFNALTGLRAKVGNYAGVTVERKEGRLKGAPADLPITVLDLPGTYSLSPKSLDEQISRDVLFHRLPEVPEPAAVVVVVDASNLERNLYYATQVIELGYPTIVALNMMDVARENGHIVDAEKLSGLLGASVVPVVASAGEGIDALRHTIIAAARPGAVSPPVIPFCGLPEPFNREIATLAEIHSRTSIRSRHNARSEALLVLTDEKALTSSGDHYPQEFRQAIGTARQRLEDQGHDWRSAAIESRYARVSGIHAAVTTQTFADRETFSDRLDRILTHKLWGTLVFVAVMTLIFQSIFTFAQFPMHALEQGVAWLGRGVAGILPPGDLRSLLVDGVISGVGAVVVFLPQILMLFLFIGLLEDTGYMARAAFLMDRLMSKVGLHGKSFIPMLSSYACAIPGIMAARTIENPKDRLVTILIAPLMSCSARLPVYTVLIAAVIPPEARVLGFLKLSGLTLLAMYLLGTVFALLMAWLFKKTLLRSETPILIMELPPYKRPVLTVTLRHMWDRSKLFLRRAGTTILGIMILLWFLATYPKSAAIDREFEAKRAAVTAASTGGPAAAIAPDAAAAAALAGLDQAEAGAKLRHSFAGKIGRAIEPFLAPLGFDWKIGIGIVGSFAAREVFVSTMATVYNVGGGDDDAGGTTLAQAMRSERRPDGSTLYTPLLGITLMVFYVFALQCVSTVAIVKRETNSWKWALFQWCYMGALAWVLAFLTWHGGKLLGFT